MAIPPLVGAALAAGGASLLGGVLRNKAEKDAAREQMAFQERMSSTAYQRATSDMRLSGINPMLAYAQGGASSPGGAKPDVQDVISPAVSSASHSGRLAQELKIMKGQEELLVAQTDAARMNAEHSWSANQLNKAHILEAGFEMLPNRMFHLLPQMPDSRMYGLVGRQRMQELERGRQDIDFRGLDFPAARNRAAVESTPGFGRGAAYLDRVRQMLFGGGGVGVLVSPRRGGTGLPEQTVMDESMRFGKGFRTTSRKTVTGRTK